MNFLKNKSFKYKNGMSLVEIVIGLGILMIVLVGLIVSFQFFLKVSLLNTERIQSTYLLEEGIEVMRHFRDGSWSNITNLSVDTDYYLYFSGGAWNSTTTATTTNSFTRKVTLYDVYRSSNSDRIVASTSPSSKTLDADARLVTVRISSVGLNDKSLSTYLTNILDN